MLLLSQPQKFAGREQTDRVCGALPLSYWPAARTNRVLELVDQVRFELTTSRSIGEVTLSFTTFSIQGL